MAATGTSGGYSGVTSMLSLTYPFSFIVLFLSQSVLTRPREPEANLLLLRADYPDRWFVQQISTAQISTQVKRRRLRLVGCAHRADGARKGRRSFVDPALPGAGEVCGCIHSLPPGNYPGGFVLFQRLLAYRHQWPRTVFPLFENAGLGPVLADHRGGVGGADLN